jgi:hypothetical protein
VIQTLVSSSARFTIAWMKARGEALEWPVMIKSPDFTNPAAPSAEITLGLSEFMHLMAALKFFMR